MLDRVGRKLLVALLLAAVLAVGLWLAGRGSPRAPELPQPASESPAAPQRARVEPSAEPETLRERVPQPPAKAASPIDLTLQFVDPRGRALRPERVRVRLSDPQGASVELASANVDSMRFEGLAAARYVASVESQGFVHRPQTFELAATSTEDVVLWQDVWIAVVVQAQDGRPLHTLAGALGIEPRRLFYRAFEASTDPAELAAFCPPPRYEHWELCESVVGSLHLLAQPPLWVRLTLHGRPVGLEQLEPGQKEIVFRVGLATLEAGLASLRLRALESQTDTPATGATVTLRADTAPHRRDDQEDVRVAEDGSLEFARIVPGRYELVVRRGDSQYQDRIDLALGEQRDLGIVRLVDGKPLKIRVVDERGEPQQAWLEIAPFEAGKSVNELYPPMLHEYADMRGQGKLPMPARPSIVRAQQIRGNSLGPSGLMSASVRIDPAFPPEGEVTLVILDEARVKLACKVPEVRKLQLIDESGLLVLEERLDSEFAFGRGRYQLRLVGADGGVLYQRAIELRAGDQELELP